MKIIKFNNTEITLNCLSVTGQRKFIKGSERDSITFNFKADDYSIDQLLEIFKNENNTSQIIIGNDENGEEYVHSDYSIFSEAVVKDIVSQKENNNSDEITINTLSIVMGQLSYSEKLQKEQSEHIDNLSVIIADMLGGANNE